MSPGRAVVCIPVRADATGLRATLRSLEDADDRVDVIVAVDGPDPELVALAEEAGASTVVLGAPKGSYTARNAAVDALPTDAEVILFTDAGCEVAPAWVAAHRRALEGAELSGGAIEVTLSERPSPAEFVDAARNLRQEAYVKNDGFAATCNLAVRRAVLDVVRFDDGLLSSGDRDFCHRAAASGYTLVFAPDTLVYHPARRTGREVLAKARRVATGLTALPPASRPHAPPAVRPNRGLVRRARALSVGRGWWWEARVAWLDYRHAKVIRTTVARRGRG